MTPATKKTLFGGALFSAGLGGGVESAEATQFKFTPGQINSAYVYAVPWVGSFVLDGVDAVGPAYCGPISYSGTGLTVTASAVPQEFGLTHTRDVSDLDWIYSVGFVQANFNVTETSDILIAWDQGTWENFYVSLRNDDTETYIISAHHGTGATQITLTAGVDYLFVARIAGYPGGGTGFGRIVADGCPWDCEASPDGSVGIGDLFALFAQWGGAATSCDLDNGGVGITDLFELLANWGSCP